MHKPDSSEKTTGAGRIKSTLSYVLIVIATFLVLQFVLILMHEFTHSTAAWLLGDAPSPFCIIWGNPLMMTGWDEGVHYSRLFPSAGCTAEAIIGGGPLFVHAIVIVLGLFLLQRKGMTARKWLFHALYWFVIANFMELIAYVVMRPFSVGGDTGHFNRGMGLSPWILFVAGTLMVVLGLYVLFRKILPLMYALFAGENRQRKWAILSMSAFFLFLWGSGLRVVFYVYPDPQWMFGLSGFAAFGVVLFVCRPGAPSY
ncbi:MAG: hypothetical protein JW849_02740 [Phycisphaerae bacterium]|nr:hypothetical protein [Phycisphaerae bacterium]